MVQVSRTQAKRFNDRQNHSWVLLFICFPIFAFIHFKLGLPTLFDVYNKVGIVREGNQKFILELEAKCSTVNDDVMNRNKIIQEHYAIRIYNERLVNKTKSLVAEVFDLLNEKSQLIENFHQEIHELKAQMKEECQDMINEKLRNEKNTISEYLARNKLLTEENAALRYEINVLKQNQKVDQSEEKVKLIEGGIDEIAAEIPNCKEEILFNRYRTDEEFHLQDTKSARDCQNLCKTNLACMFWVYSKVEITCKLYDSLAETLLDGNCCIGGNTCRSRHLG